MDAQSFISNFEHICSAPHGSQLLRGLVFELALRGRLTKRDPNDEPASRLLKRLTEKKLHLEREEQVDRQREYEQVRTNTYPLPQSWEWTSLSAIGIINPKNSADDDELAGFCDMAALPEGYLDRPRYEQKRWGEIRKGFTHFANDDVVLAKITPCFENGKSAVIEGCPNGIGAGTTELHVVRPYLPDIDPYYLLMFVKSPEFIRTGIPLMTGLAGHKRVSREYFAGTALPLPPKEEQKRIVQSVTGLFRAIAQLEAKQAPLIETRRKANRAALNALVHSDTSDELGIAWSRITEHFSELLQDQTSIDALREAILGLAYEGRLTRQWRSKVRPQSDARTLIDAIQVKRDHELTKAEGQREKELLQVKRKLVRQKIEKPLDPIPQGWGWSSLLQICDLVIDCPHKTAPYVDKGMHLVRTTDVRNGRINLSATKKVTKATYDQWVSRATPKPGDIIFTREAPMGEAGIIPEDSWVCLGQRTMLLSFYDQYLLPEYLLYSLYEPKFKERMLKVAVGMTVKHLRAADVEELAIPVAPLDEQEEIVRQIKKYFALCDQLEGDFRKRDETQDKLALASVHAVLNMPRVITRTLVDTVSVSDEVKITETIIKKIPSVMLRLVDIMKKRIADTVLAKLIQAQGTSLDAKELWQKSGLSIDDFYAQLKQEIKDGFIAEPDVAQLKLVEVTI